LEIPFICEADSIAILAIVEYQKHTSQTIPTEQGI
jgi:hypothetical protein